MVMLSDAEVHYIQDGAAQGVRSDGRGALDVRPITLETGILPNASGSARVRVGNATDILVGIKGEIMSCPGSSEGALDFNVEYSNLISADAKASNQSQNHMEMNAELNQHLNYLYSAAGKPLRKRLCISPGRKSWLLHIDAVILNSDGNLFSILSLAVYAALRAASLPAVTVEPGEADDDDELHVDELTFKPVCDEVTKLGLPVGVSLAFLNDTVYVADCNLTEEACAKFALLVGVNDKRKVCSVVSSGSNGLHSDALTAMLADAVRLGVDLIAKLEAFLQEDEENRTLGQHDVVGFFA